MRRLALATMSVLLATMAAHAQTGNETMCQQHENPAFPTVIPLSAQDASASDYSGYELAEPIRGSNFEMHVVGSYEGSGTITIGPTERPIVLVLTSYESSRWQLKLLNGARLARVIVQGYEPTQRVTGLPDRAVLEDLGRGPTEHTWQGADGDTYMSAEFKRYIGQLRFATGLYETSFQGSYDVGAQFSVPPDHNLVVAGEPLGKRVPPPILEDIDHSIVAMDASETSIADLPPEFQPAAKLLLSLMRDARFPILLPRSGNGDMPVELRPLQFPDATQTTYLTPNDRECSDDQSGSFVGTAEAEIFACAWGDQWYALGGGDDVLDDSWGDDVVVVGTGDQILKLGWGHDIAVFTQGWGNATISKTCHDAVLTRADWSYPYTNFLVFGPGIDPAAFVWRDEQTLVYPPTGAELTLIDDCFSFVFAEPGMLAAR